MNKKFIYIIISIVLALFIGTIALILITTSPVITLGNPAKDSIFMPFIAPNSRTIFYYNGVDTIKKWNLTNNQVEDWIKFPFTSIDNINYSPDGNQALIYWSNPQGNNNNERTWLIDLKNKKIIKEIGQNIINNAWSPDSKSIVYQFFSQTNHQNELIKALADNTNQQVIANLDLSLPIGEVIDILWPNNQTIVYFPLKEEKTPVDIKSINLNDLKQKTIISQVLPNIANIITDQNKIIISLSNQDDDIVTLNIYDLNTNQTKAIDKNDLFLSKTSQIANTNIFYAGWRGAKQSTDSIIRFDTDGKIAVIKAKLPDKLEVSNLMSPDKKTLFFLNGNQLYKMTTNL
ncbi:MAG: hypothetical protein WCP93_01100 [Candidatus Berkelbacteria bacterium]